MRISDSRKKSLSSSCSIHQHERPDERGRERGSLKEIRITQRSHFQPSIEDTIRGKKKKMTRGREGSPRILGVPGTIHRGDAKRVANERGRRGGVPYNNRRQYPGIKLIPACVAHQWPQTNRQSDFMLWPVSRWQPARPSW